MQRTADNLKHTKKLTTSKGSVSLFRSQYFPEQSGMPGTFPFVGDSLFC